MEKIPSIPSIPSKTGPRRRGGTVTRPPRYQRLSKAAKLAYALDRLREGPVECPACQVYVLPRELDGHALRCAGRAWAGDLVLTEAWVPWAGLRALGLRWGTLHGWLLRGRVRRRRAGAEDAWHYSRADLEAALAALADRHRRLRSVRGRAWALRRWRK